MNIFLYGTLMKGLAWHRLLTPDCVFIRESTIQGKLYLLPNTVHPVPCAVLSTDKEDRVKGELWDIPLRVAQRLEDFEAQAGYSPVKVEVKGSFTGIPDSAIAYIYPAAAVERGEYTYVPSGDFRQYLASLL